MKLKWRPIMNSKFPLNHFRFIVLSQLNAVTPVLHFIQNRNCSCFDLNYVWLLRKEKIIQLFGFVCSCLRTIQALETASYLSQQADLSGIVEEIEVGTCYAL